MKWQNEFEKIAYNVLTNDPSGFVHLGEHERKRIAKTIGMKIAEYMGYHK